MSELLFISDIKQDAATQPRNKMDMAVIDEYAEGMKAGTKFPPLQVFRVKDHYILVDGYHRLWAAQSAKIQQVLCNVHMGTMRDAILFASGVNATHGIRRTNDDKRRAVERLLVDSEWGQWSDNKIAEICNVSQPFVSKLRGVTSNVISEKSEESPKECLYATKHGTVAKMNTGNIGKKTVPVSQEHIDPKYEVTKKYEQEEQTEVSSHSLEVTPLSTPSVQSAGKTHDSQPEQPEEPAPAIVTEPVRLLQNAPCIDSKKFKRCPDGQDHSHKEPHTRGRLCLLWNQPCSQLPKNQCYFDMQQQHAAEHPEMTRIFDKDRPGFHQASARPSIQGIPKASIDPGRTVTITFDSEQWEILKNLQRDDFADGFEEAVKFCVDEIGERSDR
ncbi:MAG: ParB N-terminal domain-containing protein [Methanoregula sp.]